MRALSAGAAALTFLGKASCSSPYFSSRLFHTVLNISSLSRMSLCSSEAQSRAVSRGRVLCRAAVPLSWHGPSWA